MRENGLKDVIKRLDVIIALLLRDASGSEAVMSTRERIMFLYGIGMTSQEIAGLLGKKTGYISKEISVLKTK